MHKKKRGGARSKAGRLRASNKGNTRHCCARILRGADQAIAGWQHWGREAAWQGAPPRQGTLAHGATSNTRNATTQAGPGQPRLQGAPADCLQGEGGALGGVT